MDRQAQQQMHQQAHGAMMSHADDEFNREEYLERLVTHGMDRGTAQLLHNLLTPNFVLSRLENAEKEELKWLARIEALHIRRLHPARGSVVTGERRQFLLSDSADNLKPLNEKQKTLLNQAVMAIFSRIARSHKGWQQDKLNEQITVSRTETDEEESEGGLFSR